MHDGDVPAGCRVAVLLADPSRRRILVRDGLDDGLPALPTTAYEPDVEVSTRETLTLVEALIGRPIVPLRTIVVSLDERREPLLVVVEPEPVDMEPPAGLRWADPASLRDRILPEDARNAFAWWLDRQANPGLARADAPWMRPGWFDRASAWMAARMASADRPATGPARVVYQWPLATVLRAPSTAGACFLKCAATHFGREASITAALAARTPGWVPAVLDVEPDENWLLMDDLGEDVLGNGPADTWAEGLVRLADIQRAWAGSTADLEAAGATRRELGALADAVPTLLDVDGLGDRLEPGMLQAWLAATPRLVDACRRLADLGAPETLVHGDMHPWNVARTERGPVVFDWTDAAIGPPLVDLATYLVRTPSLDERRRMGKAYLAAVSWVRPRDHDLALDLAMVVGALYQVQSYGSILESLDPLDRIDLEGADVSWLGKAIEGLERGIAVGADA